MNYKIFRTLIFILITCTLIIIVFTLFQNEYIRPMERAINRVKNNIYTEEYDCDNFSTDLQYELNKENIGSSIIIGEKPNGERHAIVGVWVEPQTGEFVDPNKLEVEITNIKCDK